jgi:soluble lytic murein transglycosylase-like protein
VLRSAGIAVLASLMGSFGHAALWGYVDAQGVAHFANRQVDSRYSLVLSDQGAPAVAPDKVPGKASAPASMLIWLEIAPEVKRVQPWVREAASRHGVDAELINSLIAVESGFNDKALSPKGAVGLMQLMPATAQRFMAKGLEPKQVATRLAEPRTNIAVGTRLMADLLKRHRRIDVALAAWSAGDGAVQRSGGEMPPIDETRAHVHQVLELYWALLQRRQTRGVQEMKLHASP